MLHDKVETDIEHGKQSPLDGSSSRYWPGSIAWQFHVCLRANQRVPIKPQWNRLELREFVEICHYLALRCELHAGHKNPKVYNLLAPWKPLLVLVVVMEIRSHDLFQHGLEAFSHHNIMTLELEAHLISFVSNTRLGDLHAGTHAQLKRCQLRWSKDTLGPAIFQADRVKSDYDRNCMTFRKIFMIFMLTWYNNLMALARTWRGQLFDQCFVRPQDALQRSNSVESWQSNFGTWMSSLLLKGL